MILLSVLLAAASAQEGLRYGWLAVETRGDDHEIVVTLNDKPFPLPDKPFVASPLKDGANVLVVTFKARPGRDLSKSKGSALRLGLSPSTEPKDGELLELCDLGVRVAAAEAVLKLEMKKSAPGVCATVERHWYDADRKRPNEEFEMERDVAQGTVASTVHREWAADGKMKHEIAARNEKITSATYYDPSGKPGAEIRGGAGWARQFHDNGKICQESPYKNGVLEGEERDFDDQGRLQAVTTYAAGKLQGPHRRYDEAGRLRVEGAHAAGEKDGPWIRRDEQGKEVARSVFEKGKRISGDDSFDR